MNLTSDIQQLPNEEYLLEYLALLVDGKSFNEALKEFINIFDLAIEEDYDRVYIASGNDFSIQAKAISSGGTASTAVLLKVMTETEYDLQTARELLEEKVIDIIFTDLVLLRDSPGERRNHKAYILLNELENMLRKVVAVRTASLSGKTWWKDRVDNCFTDKRYEKRKNGEISDTEITQRLDQVFHEIFYIDLSTLKTVIEEPNNWKDGFAEDLKVLRNLDRLDFLNKLRRKIAHNRFLSQANFDNLHKTHAHLMHLCRRALGEL